VNRARIGAKSLLLLGSALAVTALLGGCSTPAVGAPCLPEQVPEEGFDRREAYVESSSVQCETRVCIVYLLEGDPRIDDCVPAAADPNDPMSVERVCPSEDEVEKRVYCTCRCNSGNTGFAECECPDGFTCVDVLEQGGPGVRGGYCVRNGTFSGS
jgi:hypothetical protein